MTAEEFLVRRAAVCLSGVVYWVGVLVLARKIRKRIGHSPNVKPRGAKEKLLWLGWIAVGLIWIGQPLALGELRDSPVFGLIPGLLHPAGLAAGLAMLVLGYAATLWTYSVMGANWRIGVNQKEKTKLVCTGPFAWVRHPIYALQVVMLAGAALLLPTLLSLGALVAHFCCVAIKAADEENYLTQVHGQAYRDYAASTGRLIPKPWGRSRAKAGPSQSD